MRIDLSAIGLFQRYYAGNVGSERLLEHPAYQTILAHTQLFGDGLEAADIDQAMKGEPSRFYGLKQIHDRLHAVLDLAAYIDRAKDEWVATAERELSTLMPGEPLDHIVVYPVVGYDIGIGLRGRVAMNINQSKYLEEPAEFLYYMIHEATHVLFEPYHALPTLKSLGTPSEWLDFFLWATHYEGYATFAPLRLRLEKHHIQDRDYVVLTDQALLARSIEEFGQAKQALEGPRQLTDDRRLELIYGPSRICYRVGCELIRRILRRHGPEEVTAGAYMNPRAFWDKHGHLLRE